VTGIRTSCRNERNTGRVGCGATYSGNQGHCVDVAPWSDHPDGLCHNTFGSVTTSDAHYPWGVHTDPRTLPDKIHQDDRGVWRGVNDRDWSAFRAAARGAGSPQTPLAVDQDQSGGPTAVWAPYTNQGEV